MLLGMAGRAVLGPASVLRPGLALGLRFLLRGAVVLLGLQVTVGQISALGLGTLVAVLGGLIGCFCGTVWLGKLMGVERRLARLIAVGTSVCGASAIAGANSVTHASDEDLAYALATVTLFGTLAMLVAPAAALLFHLDPGFAGLWLGSSIHEIAQVVGAATQLGDNAVQVATLAKMTRVLMLAPLVLALLAYERRRNHRTDEPRPRLPIPWFVFGFLGLAGIASLGGVPPVIIHASGQMASFMLAAALGAMGFGVELQALRRKGLRPLLLALFAWLLISGISFGLLHLMT